MRGLKFLEWVLITVVHSYLRLTQIMKKKYGNESKWIRWSGAKNRVLTGDWGELL